MKTVKIYCVPSHTTDERISGVDFARVIQPMQHLNGKVVDGVKFVTKVYDPKKDSKTADWRKIAKKYDIIFFNYTVSAWAVAHMGVMARHYKKLLIMDSDDSLWDVQPDNPAFTVFEKGKGHIENFTAICDEVDYMTTTSGYLRNVIVHNTHKKHGDIEVFPNYVDFGLYKYRPKFKDTHDIQLLHFGSTTHFLDLANEEFAKGIDKVFRNYPNVGLVTVGAFDPGYQDRWGTRYESMRGHVDVYKWISDKFPGFMEESDILVVPLEDNVYTRCKSNIKWLEASSAKLPGVWQNIRQYKECVRDGENGFLVSSREDWYNAIAKLIDDKEMRKRAGETAFNDVEKGWQMKDHAADYGRYFKKCLTE